MSVQCVQVAETSSLGWFLIHHGSSSPVVVDGLSRRLSALSRPCYFCSSLLDKVRGIIQRGIGQVYDTRSRGQRPPETPQAVAILGILRQIPQAGREASPSLHGNFPLLVALKVFLSPCFFPILLYFFFFQVVFFTHSFSQLQDPRKVTPELSSRLVRGVPTNFVG